MDSATWWRTPAAASAVSRLRPEVSKNSSAALSSNEGELARSITTCVPAMASFAGCRTGAAERLVHEAADGARAAAALGAAAETAIDPAGRAHPLRLDGGADILIAQHIARTDDHGAMAPVRPKPTSGQYSQGPGTQRKTSPSTATWQTD